MAKKTIYTVGGTVQAGKGIYIERKADVELLELCRQGELAFILSSRQIGKSSLLIRTALQLEAENIRTVLIDLSAIGVKVSRDEWYKGILNEIQSSLDLETDIFDWWEVYNQLGPAQRLGKFFRDVLLRDVKEPVVLFFDEIDSTLSLPFADDFYTAIRAVHNGRSTVPEYGRLSFVLVGVATPGDLITDNKRTPFNIGKRVELNDFTLSEALPLADGLGKHAEQVLAWVFNFTGGHPYLTQRMSAYLAKSSEALDERAVTDAFEQLFTGEQGNQDNNLQFVRDMLVKRSPDVRQGLLKYRKILSGKKVSDDERSILKVHLKLSGLVRPDKGTLQVRNEIYKRVFNLTWVKKNTKIDWRPIISYTFASIAIVTLLILTSLVYKDLQHIGNQSNEGLICLKSSYGEQLLQCLADLFEPDMRIIPWNNAPAGRNVFFSLQSFDKQLSIFTINDSDPEDLEVVIRGLYINLANVSETKQSTRLLEAMLSALQQAKLENGSLAKEIQSWIKARNKAEEKDWLGALTAYEDAIRLNEDNPATLFEKARIHSKLGEYDAALKNYEMVIAISPKSESEITGTPALTLTVTSRSTATGTPNVATTPTPNFDLTITPLVISSNTPTTVTQNVEPNLPPTTMSDDTPVESKFSSLSDRINAVRNDIKQNQVLYTVLATDTSKYPNLEESVMGRLAMEFAVAQTMTALSWTAVPTQTFNPNIPNIVIWMNNDLAISNPLGSTLDAEYHVINMSFPNLPNSSNLRLQMDVSCLCMNSDDCCTPERTFMVIVESMKRYPGLSSLVPVEVSEVLVICSNQQTKAQIGAISVTWQDLRGYLEGNVSGYQLGALAKRVAVP